MGIQKLRSGSRLKPAGRIIAESPGLVMLRCRSIALVAEIVNNLPTSAAQSSLQD
jgi:hypothetical protein